MGFFWAILFIFFRKLVLKLNFYKNQTFFYILILYMYFNVLINYYFK
jgi:hypothetical protein